LSTQFESRVSDGVIRQELNRILQSSMFVQSDRLTRFLRYAVEHAISDRNEPLKEYIIGTEVYDRKPPYHPSQDSIVRTEARRLRAKLKEYYETEGKEDPIFIYFRPGNYVPVFRMKDADVSYQVVKNSDDDLFIEGAGVPVAVIPFLDVSGQPLSSKYARGVTDELIHELMQSEGCRVVSANSIAHLGAQSSDLPSLALKLGVQVVLEGTVREEGSQIRVTARIVNADGFQLWSQRFDAEADPANQFVIQEQFASALVSRIRPQQSILRTADATVGPMILTVYPLILKSEALLEEGTATAVQAALVKFREVTEMAPAYARPFCGMAHCYMWTALHGALKSTELISNARVAAERAIEIDPVMIEALTTMGSVLGLEWKWKDAEESFEKAVGLQSNATGERQYAMLLTMLGRFDEAWVYLENSQQIDPFSYLQKTACAKFFYLSRRYDEAVNYFIEPARYGLVPVESRLYLALMHAMHGNRDQARSIVQVVQRSAGAQLDLRAWIAEIYAYCEERPLAEKIVKEFGLHSAESRLSNYRKALLAMALDKKEEALPLLASSFAQRDAELPFLAVDPRFDPIRELSQVVDILEKVRCRDV
jgi:TolB-like protein/tetratricopeptide (TPR) repeat protein